MPPNLPPLRGVTHRSALPSILLGLLHTIVAFFFFFTLRIVGGFLLGWGGQVLGFLVFAAGGGLVALLYIRHYATKLVLSKHETVRERGCFFFFGYVQHRHGTMTAVLLACAPTNGKGRLSMFRVLRYLTILRFAEMHC